MLNASLKYANYKIFPSFKESDDLQTLSAVHKPPIPFAYVFMYFLSIHKHQRATLHANFPTSSSMHAMQLAPLPIFILTDFEQVFFEYQIEIKFQ